jgi:large subunit ribosomal protein L32
MATPKRKKGRSPTRHRGSQWKAQPPTYAECPQCHQPKLPHRVCANCGYYAGREAVEVES